jgi:hypothetical protein
MTTTEDMLIELYGPIKFGGFSGLVKYCVINNITTVDDISSCSVCDKKVTYNKAYPNKGFSVYCSANCSRSSKTVDKNAIDNLSNYDWLYNERIILRKSKDQIAESLGISVTPVNRWIKHHNIPNVKYHESDYKTKIILENKQTLQEMYDIGDTLDDIAKKLGTSKSTLSLFMRKHGIEMRESNSYDRNVSYVSKGELEILDYIKSLTTTKILTNTRNTISNELDIYLPEYNLAIEYNGLYWHTEKYKDKNLHVSKTNQCQDTGIFLYHIWEDDWKNKNSIVKSMIKNKLGLTTDKIFARKCKIGLVSIEDAKIFLDTNHIQGTCKASLHVGLYYLDKLVALMTFNKPRFNKKCDWELVRYTTLLDHNVVGGFSKILNYFRKYNSGTIVSYADRCYSDGNVYKKNGFSLVSINKPSYWYLVDHGKRKVSRTEFTKSKLKDFDQSMSEKDIVGLLGINRIWNCGTLTFIL